MAGALADLVFPPLCQLCEERSPLPLCETCAASIKRLAPPWCRQCGHPFPPLATGSDLCADCRQRPPAFDHARAVGYYTEPLDEAIRRLKFHSRTRLAGPLGETMGRLVEEAVEATGAPAPDCVVPVPLHWFRRWRRGFNQSLLLAKSLSRASRGIPVSDALVRTRWTTPQTRLRRRARLENLKGAFALRSGASVEGRHALLVDDLMTTGATLNECARTLRKAKCASVFCVTAGRQVRM